MRVVIACSMALVVLLAWTSPPAAVEDMGLITGGEKGTYYQFGLDLQKLVKPAGINLNVYPSKGSIENVYAVSCGRLSGRPRRRPARPGRPAVGRIPSSTRSKGARPVGFDRSAPRQRV